MAELKNLGSLNKLLTDILEGTGASLSTHASFDKIFAEVSTQLGVQPREMVLVGVYGTNSADKKDIVSVTVGFSDPDPNSSRELITYKDALERSWRPVGSTAPILDSTETT